MEPLPSGNLPPGFDPSTCRSVWVLLIQSFFFYSLYSDFWYIGIEPFVRSGICRYAGNIHTQVTEVLLQEIFASTGPIESCKLIRKDKVEDIFFFFYLGLFISKCNVFSKWLVWVLTTVIIWICSLLWSKICWSGYHVSQRKASVSILLHSLIQSETYILLNIHSLALYVILGFISQIWTAYQS